MRAMLIALAACSDPPGPPRPAPADFEVQSPDVGGDGRLSAAQGCNEQSRSPTLRWPSVPTGTASIAVVVSSQGPAGTAVHWTAWDIDPTAGGIEGGVAPTHSPPLQGVTASGRVGWTPMCELTDETVVVIDVAALDAVLLPPPTISAPALRARLGAHLIGLGRLETRPPAPSEGTP